MIYKKLFYILLVFLFFNSVSGLSIGIGDSMSDLMISSCWSDNDCNDGDTSTIDSCINPGTINASCSNIPATSEFDIFLCDNRRHYTAHPDEGGEELITRINNYIFEGEVIHWKTLAFHNQGIENIDDVYLTRGTMQDNNNKVVSCTIQQTADGSDVDSCNARINDISFSTFNSSIMRMYDCYYTAESPNIAHGEFWLSVNANDTMNNYVSMDENEYWFINPEFDILIDQPLTFQNSTKPGETIYSNIVNIQNDPEEGSRVALFFQISGTDIYNSNGDQNCNNQDFISLNNVAYKAENTYLEQSFSTLDDNPLADSEGFVNLDYNNQLIIGDSDNLFNYYAFNTLTEYNTLQLQLRIDVPEGCIGEFNQGSIKIFASDLQSFNQNKTLDMPLEINIVPICTLNLECNDNNPETIDICTYPGTIDAICRNIQNDFPMKKHFDLFKEYLFSKIEI
ncbi:MAG: hypothetical protein KC506_01880 [Nanoarchaeota archaeon]|nr:hypothetical protein [Nanoarchaeota archaeon]